VAQSERPSGSWTRFDPDLVADLKLQLGDDKVAQLLPAFNEFAEYIAQDIQKNQKEKAVTDSNRKEARERARIAKRIWLLSRQLQNELKRSRHSIDDAVLLGELPAGYAPDVFRTLRGLAYGNMRTEPPRPRLSHLQDTLEHLSADAEAWERDARSISKGKPGRKTSYDRTSVAQWVGSVLANLEVRLTKSPDGPFAITLGLFYEAIGIPKPSDLYRDVAAALDDPAGYWREDDTRTPFPRPQRKSLRKPANRR
jgi:hypothetical protein